MQISRQFASRKSGYLAAFFLQCRAVNVQDRASFGLAIFIVCIVCSVCAGQASAAVSPPSEQQIAQPVSQLSVQVTAQNVAQHIAQARATHLAAKPTWASLLHVADGKANIKTPDFLLSLPDFSLDNELAATIQFLYSGKDEPKNTTNRDASAAPVCRFPARYLWLKSELNLPPLPIDGCADLSEFKQRAPADRIAIVFASENLAQPSSMMGHILLKLSGDNPLGKPVEHAISFITDAGGMNLPKLFFDSMVVGKKGFFTLSPYDEKLNLYLREEQRSIWEYELTLDSVQRALIQAHLIELKQTDLTYFFQNYNCATVIDFIIAIGASQQLPVDALWLTPKDVIKRAQTLKLIGASRVIAPNRWLIRAINEQINRTDRETVKQAVDEGKAIAADAQNSTEDLLKRQLALAYQAYRIETKQVSGPDAQEYKNQLAKTVGAKYKNQQLEASAFKNPLSTPQDSQLEFGFVRREQARFVRLSFTPATHHIEDDNRHYFSENELLLFDLSVLKNIASRQFFVDRFTVYAAKSLIPYDNMSGGLSGAIRMGFEPQFDAQLRMQKATYLSGALGRTLRYGGDIDVYALLGLGVSVRGGKPNLYGQPEIGLIVREIFDMKSSLSAVLTANAFGDKAKYQQYRFVQSKYFQNRNFSFHITAKSAAQKTHRINSFEASLKYLF